MLWHTSPILQQSKTRQQYGSSIPRWQRTGLQMVDSMSLQHFVRWQLRSVPNFCIFYQTNSNDPRQIQASGARIEFFNSLQIQCGIATPLKIPLHSNVRWGTAHAMLDRAHKLRQVSHSSFIPQRRLLKPLRPSLCSLDRRIGGLVPSL